MSWYVRSACPGMSAWYVMSAVRVLVCRPGMSCPGMSCGGDWGAGRRAGTLATAGQAP